MIFAIIETAMMFFAQQVLDSAVEDASRIVRTGQAQSQSFDLAAFRNYLCGYTFGLFNCSNIVIEVQSDRELLGGDDERGRSKLHPHHLHLERGQQAYDAGGGRNIIQVSAYYRWPLTIVLPYFNLKNQPDNYRLIAAIRVFRNEPFSST